MSCSRESCICSEIGQEALQVEELLGRQRPHCVAVGWSAAAKMQQCFDLVESEAELLGLRDEAHKRDGPRGIRGHPIDAGAAPEADLDARNTAA